MRRILALAVCALVLGVWAGAAPAASITLTGTIRDFKAFNETGGHPDFESALGDDKGIVQTTLGADGKPVYNGSPITPTTHGATAFNQWYNDTAGVNLSTLYSITLVNSSGQPDIYTYDNPSFFPIDNQLFGNYDGWGHNYHFTYELHTTFTYQAGQTFTFTGDDDVWAFINNQRVIDLGGVHGAESQSVNLDTLSLTVGNTYNFDLFFAERHTSQSDFRVDTSIVLEPVNPDVPEPLTILGVCLGIGSVGGYLRRRLSRRAQDPVLQA